MAIPTDVFDSDLWEAHHVITKKELGYLPELQDLLYKAKKAGIVFDFGGEENGLLVQKKVRANGVNGHELDINGNGNHHKCDINMDSALNRILNTDESNDIMFKNILDLIGRTNRKIENNVILGLKDFNNTIVY